MKDEYKVIIMVPQEVSVSAYNSEQAATDAVNGWNMEENETEYPAYVISVEDSE